MNALSVSLQDYGPGAVFLATLVEALLGPLPTPPVVMAAGAFMVAQELSWRQAFLPFLLRIALPGAAGTTAGTLPIFALCYWGGKRAIDRYGRYMGVGWEGVSRLNARMEGQLEVAVLIARAIPLFPISAATAAGGILRMTWPSFLWWTFGGCVLRYLMLAYLGWLTKGGWDRAAQHRWQGWLAAAAALSAAAGLIWWKRRAAAKAS